MSLLRTRADQKSQELRYHSFFIGSAAFALIYDMLHDEEMTGLHLPHVTMGLRYLYSMREGEPITSTIRAIESALRKLDLQGIDKDNICKPANGVVYSELISDSTAALGIEKRNCNAQDSHTQCLNRPVPTLPQVPGPLTRFPPQSSTITPLDQARPDEMGLWEVRRNSDPSAVNIHNYNLIVQDGIH
jgi:hypothetical protein